MDKGIVRYCRTLTSAWIETAYSWHAPVYLLVALSRVRGLKPFVARKLHHAGESHSHECVD